MLDVWVKTAIGGMATKGGRLASVGSGTLYPLLARWEKAGWLISEWEAVDPSEGGRPRRRLYKLTAHALCLLVG